MSQPTLIMMKKELLDAIRDKRSVMAALYYAIGTPILVAGLFFMIIGKVTSPEDLHINIKGSEYAPELVRALKNRGVYPAEDIKPDSGIKAKAITLIIDEEYASNVAKGESARIVLRADHSDTELGKSIGRVKNLIRAYSGEVATLRLLLRGVDPQVLNPIKLIEQDEATATSRGGMILGMALFTMIYSVFISGMNLSIDTSAGERERNSLGLLLSQPVTPMNILLSKLFSVTAFAMAGLVLTLIMSRFAYSYVPWQELGFTVEVDLKMALSMIVVGFPIAVMAASMQLFVSFLAKSFKEAQSYLTIVLFVPMALAMSASYEIAPDTLKWLPVSGQQQALMEFVKGNALPVSELLVSTGITVLIAAVLCIALNQALKSEKVVFGL